MSNTARNYHAHGGSEWVIGGKLTFLPGALVEGVEGLFEQMPAAELIEHTPPHVPDSTATTVAALREDFNGLLAVLRESGMKMIADAQTGKIDLILCKSISRFSRNIVECQRYTELLRSRNITVVFEKEKLRTDEPTSNLIFSLMCAIAQDESHSISENVKWGYKERYKRGEYNLGNNRILGYDCVDGKLVPNHYADAIRFIYQTYLEGKNIEEVRRLLSDRGVLTKKGTLISHNDILYILKNETYKGDKLLQKDHPRDLITKKPDSTVPFESNYLENDHEAVVSRDMWDAVQQKLKKNKELEDAVGHRGGQPHFLYGKVFCGECGAPMTRRTVNGAGGAKCKTWICRENRNRKRCKGRNVKEEELLKFIDAERIVVKGSGIEIG